MHTALDQLNDPNAEVRFGTGAAEFKLAIDALQAKQTVNYDGASGNVDFDTVDPTTGATGDTYDYATVWKIQGGQFHETQFFNCLKGQGCATLTDLPTQ